LTGAASARTTPLVSVIVPTRSRPEALGHCLEALSRLPGGPAYEVIVVDDGSPPSAAARVKEQAVAAGARFVRQEHAGPASARNRGAAEARGELLAFLDDDCRPDPGWLAAIAGAVHADGAVLVGGPIVNGNPGNLLAEATQLLVSYVSEQPQSGRARREFLPSCNLAISKERFVGVGGFDTSFVHAGGEDREFCAHCLRDGFEIRYVQDAIVRHFHNLSLGSYLRQHVRYGRGARVYRRRCRQSGVRVGLAPPRWYLGLLAAPFRSRDTLAAAPLGFLLALAQAATAVGMVLSLSEPSPPSSSPPADRTEETSFGRPRTGR
jgi:GT2 family glycosyltransferase